MVVLLNKIGEEISNQKKIGSIFITKEILQADMDLDYKHEWKYRHRFGKKRVHRKDEHMYSFMGAETLRWICLHCEVKQFWALVVWYVACV